MVAELSKSEAERGGSITRDFLGGGCFGIDSKELDLDLDVPLGWEKRLDLQSGKVYIQRCKDPPIPRNCPPQARTKQTLNLSDDTNLDLKILSSASTPNYQSVCTLDKVKSALDRAERGHIRKRWMVPMLSLSKSVSSSPSNSSSISVREMDDEDERMSSTWTPALSSDQSGLLVVAGCPGCLLYVLISKNDPKCPKCNSIVRLPVSTKKPRIDLNISI